MNILEDLKTRAAHRGGRVVLPESHEIRTLQAADIVLAERMAEVILVGKPETVLAKGKELDLDLSRATIIDPATYPDLEKFAEYYYDKRKEKGVSLEQARETVSTDLFFGTMLVQFGVADGMVAGAHNTTPDVMRAALQVVGVKPGLKTVSSCFIMVVPDYMNQDRVYVFADCAVVPNPDASQLADIAMSTAQTRRSILGDEPRVALLSFSTLGSAEHELVTKVQETKKILDERKADFLYDGEMQLDTAIVPKIARIKAPGSKIAGDANTLIFPDLQSGNIGYKLVQRFAKAEAIGPIIQGLALPICDLSRGCSVSDIVNTCALVLLMKK